MLFLALMTVYTGLTNFFLDLNVLHWVEEKILRQRILYSRWLHPTLKARTVVDVRNGMHEALSGWVCSIQRSHPILDLDKAAGSRSTLVAQAVTQLLAGVWAVFQMLVGIWAATSLIQREEVAHGMLFKRGLKQGRASFISAALGELAVVSCVHRHPYILCLAVEKFRTDVGLFISGLLRGRMAVGCQRF